MFWREKPGREGFLGLRVLTGLRGLSRDAVAGWCAGPSDPTALTGRAVGSERG